MNGEKHRTQVPANGGRGKQTWGTPPSSCSAAVDGDGNFVKKGTKAEVTVANLGHARGREIPALRGSADASRPGRDENTREPRLERDDELVQRRGKRLFGGDGYSKMKRPSNLEDK